MVDVAHPETFEQRYLSGAQLYGDDFGPEQISEWFDDEREGYANLNSGIVVNGSGYSYHQLNLRHGFRRLPTGRRFRHALGVGSAFGAEFEPIVDRLDAVTILEPSDQLVAAQIGKTLRPSYVKPAMTGIMPFPDATFDLAVCLGTLHHIPNVSTVLGEIARVIEPGGYALIREPIVSMGDWRGRREGATKRERGIPLNLLREMVIAAGFTIERDQTCGFPAMSRLGRALRLSQYNSAFLTAVDQAASTLTRPLYRYHATSAWQKVRPTSLFVVARR